MGAVNAKPSFHRPRSSANARAVGIAGAMFLVLWGLPTAASVPPTAPPDLVTICHATGSETNPFVVVTAAAAGVFNGHLGADHQNESDIIPPFSYQGVTYSQNWANASLAIHANGCVAPVITTSPPATTATPATTSTSATNTTQVPVLPTTAAIALGTLGALGGAYAVMRRRN